MNWYINSVKVKFLHIIALLVLLTLPSGCSFLKPEPPVLPVTPCHDKPLACPPPFPCDPVIFPAIGKHVSLSELVDLSLRNNPQTRGAWANARVSAAQLGQANSAFFPQVSIQWTAQRALQASPQAGIIVPNFFTTYSPQLVVSYLLWDFGTRYAAMENAIETLIASNWNYSWAIQSVMFSVIQGYYNYLSAVGTLEVDKLNLKDTRVILAAAEANHHAGINTIVDVLQAKAQVVNAEMTVVQQEGAVETAWATLATALSLPPDIKFPVSKPAGRPAELVCCDVERMLHEAKCCRADLEGLRAGIKAQRYSVDQQYATLWPTVQGNFTGGRTYYHKQGHDKNDFVESVQINIPIFSGFSQVNAIRQAEAQVDSLIATYKNQENQALLTVMTNYFAVKTAIETFEYSKVYVEYAQKAYDATVTGYKAGTQSMVNVIQSQQTLFSARTGFIQAEFNWYTSLANLAYSRGALISYEPCEGVQ